MARPIMPRPPGISTNVPGLPCEGKHHVFDQDAEVCRCGGYKVLGSRGLVPVVKAGG